MLDALFKTLRENNGRFVPEILASKAAKATKTFTECVSINLKNIGKGGTPDRNFRAWCLWPGHCTAFVVKILSLESCLKWGARAYGVKRN